MSTIIDSMQVGGQAMETFSWAMNVAAHNLANVNTAGFQPQRATFATGPNDLGVQLEAVFQGDGLSRDRPSGVDGPIRYPGNLVGDYDNTVTYPPTAGMPPEILDPSGTDIAREMVNMIVAQRGYEANAKVVGTADDMMGTLLDIST